MEDPEEVAKRIAEENAKAANAVPRYSFGNYMLTAFPNADGYPYERQRSMSTYQNVRRAHVFRKQSTSFLRSHDKSALN